MTYPIQFSLTNKTDACRCGIQYASYVSFTLPQSLLHTFAILYLPPQLLVGFHEFTGTLFDFLLHLIMSFAQFLFSSLAFSDVSENRNESNYTSMIVLLVIPVHLDVLDSSILCAILSNVGHRFRLLFY